MPKLGERAKLRLLGRTSGEPGALLRHVQSGTLSDERFPGDPFAQVTSTGLWGRRPEGRVLDAGHFVR